MRYDKTTAALSIQDKALWLNGTLSKAGIEQAIQDQDPRVAEYIIKLVKLDPMPFSWFYENEENDQLSNPNRTPRQAHEVYNSKSESARGEIFGLLNDLKDVRANKASMKSRFKQVLGDYPFHPRYGTGINNRSKIKQIYAVLADEKWKKILSFDHSLIPDRLLMNEVLTSLYADDSLYARQQIFHLARFLPFRYGVWQGIKSIFRESIARGDWEMFGIWLTRFDIESGLNNKPLYYMNSYRDCDPENREGAHSFNEYKMLNYRDVTRRSVSWLARWGWKTLRDIASAQPQQYVECVVEYLRQLPSEDYLQSVFENGYYGLSYNHALFSRSWVLSHILFYEQRTLSRSMVTGFYLASVDDDDYNVDTQYRAYSHLWSEVTPILRLFETAESEFIQDYAVRLLMNDFGDRLGDLDIDFIHRLVRLGTESGLKLAYEWLSTLSGLSQDDFVSSGAYRPCIDMIKACVNTEPEDEAYIQFALSYVLKYKSDLVEHISAQDVLWMINCGLDYPYDESVYELGLALLNDEAYSSKFSLADWTGLIDNELLNEAASKHIKGVLWKQLDLQWYRQEFDSDRSAERQEFAVSCFDEGLHPDEGLLEFVEDGLNTPGYSRDIQTAFLNKNNSYLKASCNVALLNGQLVSQKLLDVVKALSQKKNDESEGVLSGLFSKLSQDETIELDDFERASFTVIAEQYECKAAALDKLEQRLRTWFSKTDDRTVFARRRNGLGQLDISRLKGIHSELKLAYFFSPDGLRTLVVNRNYKVRQAIVGSDFELQNLGMDFLKKLVEPNTWGNSDWVSELGSYAERIQDAIKARSYYLPSRCDNDLLNAVKNAFQKKIDVTDIGLGWIKEKAQDSRTDYNFVRELAIEKLPMSAWADGDDASAAAGSAALLNAYVSQSNLRGVYAQFLLLMIQERYNPARIYSQSPRDPLSEDLAFQKLTWSELNDLFASEKPLIRELGLFFARYQLNELIKSENIGFAKLETFFTHPNADVQQFFKNCVELGATAKAGIDFSAEQFKASDLFEYLESNDRHIRDLGIRIIQLYPEKFSLIEELIKLSSNSDRRIRELIVSQLWRHYQLSGAIEWKPAAQSRVPQSPVAKRRIKVRTQSRSGINNVGELAGNEWVIGDGLVIREDKDLDLSIHSESLTAFLRYILFRLPPKSPSWSQAGRSLEAVPAWQNKCHLIEAMRTIALQDREFAAVIRDVLNELTLSDGKGESAAALVALTQINAAHA